jgi:Uma2 family endonuclease
MAKSRTPRFDLENFAQLQERLGDIPAERIRLRPPPGTATEEDALRVEARTDRLCEVIDGTLVEKPMGYYESRVAAVLIYFVEAFLREHKLGIVTGEAGRVRTEPGQIRMPDVAFFSWDHFPRRRLPAGSALSVVPDLAVEVLSPSNTKKEMERKRRENFLGGTKLVWEVDPFKRTVRVYTAPDESGLLDEGHILDGGDVLPGFRLSIREWFEEAGEQEAAGDA